MLEDNDFCFFLALFHKIMPHVDMLYNQLQKRNIDSVYISGIIQRFIDNMQAIREAVPSLVEGQEYRGPEQEPPTKKRRTLGEDRQHHLALERDKSSRFCSRFHLLSNNSSRMASKATSNRHFLLCPVCKNTQASLSVHLTRVCMKRSSKEAIQEVVEKAKQDVLEVLQWGRVFSYRHLRDIMDDANPMSRMIQELERRHMVVPDTPSPAVAAQTSSVPVVAGTTVQRPESSATEQSEDAVGGRSQCPRRRDLSSYPGSAVATDLQAHDAGEGTVPETFSGPSPPEGLRRILGEGSPE
ncbi:uncharacterized protein [Paramormyrops kingsleyae]|uniref:uncharacterized protein n=1 Tax=Paramormyrops kingsleyae TaxID=1676925 RepID=UPI003B97A998